MMLRERLPLEVREAVQKRETGDLAESRKIFERVLAEVEPLRSSTGGEDQDAYIGIMGEWIIQLRHEGKRKFEEALGVAQEIYNYDKRNRRANPNAIRGVSNTNIDLENYEMATGFLRELIALLPERDSARRGEAMSHLAKCLFRTGKVKEAEDMIDQSLGMIDKNSAGMEEMFVAVWESHALKVKALILNANGRKEEAMKLAKESLDLASKFNLVIRMREAKEAMAAIESQ